MGVVCFRFIAGIGDAGPKSTLPATAELDQLNSDIVERINASGRAYLTQTKLRGRTVMRIGLGNVLTTLGKTLGDAGRLAEAVAAYRSALEEFSRDTSPRQWAVAMSGLSDALVTLGGLSGSRHEIEEGRDALAALRDYDLSGGHAFNAEDHYRDRLAAADAALAQLP